MQTGLQLCDNNASSSYGAARCDYLNGGCQGSGNSSCWPNHIWSGLFLASGYYQGFALNSGGLKSTGICDGAGHCINTNAFAVRCVLDLKIHYRPGFCSCARCGKALSTALRSV